MANDKLDTCFLCKHMRISYEGDWSDVTPGDGMRVECWMNHFSYQNDADFDWHATITKSRNCPDAEAR